MIISVLTVCVLIQLEVATIIHFVRNYGDSALVDGNLPRAYSISKFALNTIAK